MNVLKKTSLRKSLFIVSLLALSGFNSSPGNAQIIGNTGNLITWYKPALMTTWEIQLQGKANTSYQVDLYDLDLFDTPVSTIAQLRASGRHVICYFSAGSSENWRPDFKSFVAADMGKGLSGWPGEKWLDVRSTNVRAIMAARMDMAKLNGCDGIDPDNVDGYTNKSGFPLTAANQIDYNTFLATEAHKRGLSVGLKNDGDQAQSLASVFDFAVNEQCFQYNECSSLAPFTKLGKPVLNIEYQKKYVTTLSQRQALCKNSLAMKFSTLVLPLDLNDKYRYSCLSN